MLSRRQLLSSTSLGFAQLALSGMLAEQAKADQTSPLAARAAHFPPRARRIIFLCMRGGPSHMETFDYKPQLNADNGKPSKNKNQKLFGSQWGFKQYGHAGHWVSDLLPHMGRVADQLCVLKGMHCDSNEHGAALTQMHTGSIQFHRPSIGSWILYGLGTENTDLPGFLSIKPPAILGGARNYGNAFLPAIYQGTPLGTMGKSMQLAKISNLERAYSTNQQSRQLSLIQDLNRSFGEQRQRDAAVEGVIQSYELAFRMQDALPGVMDFSSETQATLDNYGIGEKRRTDDFGRQCLLARRCAEAGVRFIELTHDNWDHHGSISSLMPAKCEEIDQPIAALLADLKARGLMEDTLVVWGGEFGRTPDDPRGDGRGHNRDAGVVWLAGGGVKPGLAHGATDEHGFAAVEGRVHMHDLHATMLHLLGLDHERLTFRYGGRDFRLTDVHGNVVREILT